MVLGASETRLSSLDRQRRPAGEAVGTRSDAAHAKTLRGVGSLPRRDAHPCGNETPDDTDPAEIEALLLRGAFSGNKRLVGMCDELYDHRQWLWTFLDHENVEITNNAGERALRHAVIWRKLSFGTQSANGSRFMETMLTVIETCRQQKRNTFTFVGDAVHAHFAGRQAASLLAGA